MKKTVKLALAVVALSAASSMAFAATPGAYLGLGLGYSKLKTPTFSSAASKKTGGLGGRVFGGYNFNEYIGIEGGLNDYAQSKYTSSTNVNLKYNLYAVDVVAKAYLPISDSGFNLYALGGAALVNSKVQISNSIPSNNGTTTTRKLRPMYGVGASYDITPSVTTTLEASRIQGTGNLNTSKKAIPNADMLSLGIAYNFG